VPLLLMFSFTFYLAVKYRPFENKTMNFLTIVNEGSYILILIFYLGLYFFKEDSMTPKFRYVYFGYSLCLLVAVTILINIGVCIIEIVKGIKSACSKKKKSGDGVGVGGENKVSAIEVKDGGKKK
jgi:hypothetical protein